MPGPIKIRDNISLVEMAYLNIAKLRIRNFDAAHEECVPLDIALC